MSPTTDRNLLLMYESIRQQVAADRQTGGVYRLLGKDAQARAETLEREMRHRGLQFDPIDWS